MGMGKESREIFDSALKVGVDRLNKSSTQNAISAFIAGIYVTFGGLAALTVSGIITEFTGFHDFGWLMGSMLYPIGFIFVVFGKSELFTENFVTPVLAAWEGDGHYKDLLKLWGITLVFNVVGVLVITFFLGTSNFISGEGPSKMHVVEEFRWVSEHVFAESSYTFLWKSIIGGLLINFMSWLVIATEGGSSAKFLMIWIPTFLIMLLGAHHCIVGSSEILLGIYYGSSSTVSQWFTQYFLPAAFGNALGGIVFVAGLHYLQVSPTYQFNPN